MLSRRRRITVLLYTDTNFPSAERLDGNGMDAPLEPQDAGCAAARPRSAPAFCQPLPVAPKPYLAVTTQTPELRLASSSPPRKGTLNRPEVWRESRLKLESLKYPPVAEEATSTVDTPREPVRALWGVQASEDDLAQHPSGQSAESNAPFTAGNWVAMARGVALMLATLLAVDLFADGGLADNGPWWLDTRPLPVSLAAGLLGMSTVVLLGFAIRGSLPPLFRWAGLLCLGLLIAVALKNATVHYGLLKRGDLRIGSPIAFPLHVTACLGLVMLAIRSAPGPSGFRGTFFVLIGFNAAMVAFPLAHIACLGPTDSRRSAVTTVVFAPRVSEANSEASIEARIKVAADLYSERLTPNLKISGTEDEQLLNKMRQMAVAQGVPDSALSVIPQGDQLPQLQQIIPELAAGNDGEATLMIVSEYDHLPRLALEARRAGLSVAQVPASSGIRPTRETILREILALWRCYFRR